MDPKLVIESYVDDVVRRLPLARRGDVGVELRSLLTEELQGRADEAGRPADEAMALALLGGFGRPEDVAERYGPSGFVIVKPAAAPAFAWTALTAVAVQWALTLPAALAGARGADAVVQQLGRWWPSWGVGAFWFPGVMVVFAIIAALVGRRAPEATTWTPRRVIDRDRVNRPLLALGLVAWAAYMALLMAEPLLLDRLPPPLAAAFTFDDGFLAGRGPWLFLPWGAQFLVACAVLRAGRWRRRTRELSAVFGAALCAVLAWFVADGPVFQAKASDDITKLVLCVVILLSLVGLGVGFYRLQGQTGLPRPLAIPPAA
ncbi:MAG TPA: hypothetical protein VFE13_01115 [Caulobacteraceae bacterium]|jgi:hypothetical protein|nr:hypothetical protein [Caulobacteraceae bacterium]